MNGSKAPLATILVSKRFHSERKDICSYWYNSFQIQIIVKMWGEQDQKSNRYDSILLWLRTENGLLTSDLLTHLLSYPQSRDAIASKNLYWMNLLLIRIACPQDSFDTCCKGSMPHASASPCNSDLLSQSQWSSRTHRSC